MDKVIRTALIQGYGQDPAIVDAPVPVAGPGQVVVRIHAAALNFADLLMAKGQYQETATPPFVPGLEGAGTVLHSPPDCPVRPGARVMVSAPGTLAQVVAVDQGAIMAIPDALDFPAAAGFQVAYGTSHLALSGRGALAAGQTLVVLGAAGGVGLTAVQIGRAMGARVIGVARGADRVRAVTAAGADHAIDSAACPDLRAALRDLGGADVIYDPVGDQAGEAAFRALRPGGRFLIIGFAGGRPPVLPLNHALVKNIAIHGFYWGGYRSLDPAALRDSMTVLMGMVAKGLLHPAPGHLLPLDRLAEGYALLSDRRSTGKVVITL